MPVHHRVQIIVVFVRLSPPKRLISLLPKYVLKIQLPNYNASELHSGHNLAQSQISLYPLFCHIRTERERMHTQTPHNDNCFYRYSVSECKLEIWKTSFARKVQKCADVLNSVSLSKTEWSVIILLCDSENPLWMKESVFIIIFSRFCFCTDAPENVWSGKKMKLNDNNDCAHLPQTHIY